MTHVEYEYDVVRVVKVVDGDTVDLELSRQLDLGFHVHVAASTVQRVRLLGVDTPERGQPGWREAGEYVRQWLEDAEQDDLTCATRKGDSFGRYLATITAGLACLNDDLISAGHAIPYP